MLPLADLIAVARTADEHGYSPVADAAVAPWGIPAGVARFWRSSASHVFRVPGTQGRSPLFVRCDPISESDDGAPQKHTAHHAALMAAGAGVAALVPSENGRWSERVMTTLGPFAVSLVQAAPGEERELADVLEEERPTVAQSWGAALAALHECGSRAGLDVMRDAPEAPTALGRLTESPDPEVRAAATTVSTVPVAAWGPWVLGHGDFELDNLRWDGGRVTAFDLGEAALMPAAFDVAAAVRDLVGVDPGQPAHPTHLDAFLYGYRTAGGPPLPGEALLVGAAEVAARWLLIGSEVLALDASLPAASRPAWVPALQRSLLEHDAQMRTILMRAACALA